MNPLAILLAIIAAAPWLLLALACAAAGRIDTAAGLAAAGIGTCILALSLNNARAR